MGNIFISEAACSQMWGERHDTLVPTASSYQNLKPHIKLFGTQVMDFINLNSINPQKLPGLSFSFICVISSSIEIQVLQNKQSGTKSSRPKQHHSALPISISDQDSWYYLRPWGNKWNYPGFRTSPYPVSLIQDTGDHSGCFHFPFLREHLFKVFF